MSNPPQSEQSKAIRCELTGEVFEVGGEELDTLLRFDFPLPKLAPSERFRRKLAFRNEEKFFWRTCDETRERVYSVFAPSTAFPVVTLDFWRDKAFNPEQYAHAYDFKRLFVEQLLQLWSRVPRPAFYVKDVTNCVGIHNARKVENSFLVFNASSVKESFHCNTLWDSSHCADCHFVSASTWCYECVHCHRCKNLRWSEFCTGCEDSWFLSNCRDCTNCLFCTNLEGKSYHIRNEPVSVEEFEKAVQQLELTAQTKVEVAKEQFEAFLKAHPLPHILSDVPESTSGNYLVRCNDSLDSFECVESSNLKHCHSLIRARNCYDGIGFGERVSDSSLFVSVGGDAHDLVNCIHCFDNVSRLMYCSYCEESSDLFACVGLRGKQYCIFNMQYSKDEYIRLRDELIAHLKKREVWGRFLPSNFSGFPYNHTSASEYMPLTKVSAQMMGYRWDDSFEVLRPSQLLDVLTGQGAGELADLPNRLEDFPAERAGVDTFLCQITGRPFRITREEYNLHCRLGVALPARSFEQRHRERIGRLSPRVLRTIENESGDSFRTSFPANWRRPVVSHTQWLKSYASQVDE